MAGHLLHHVPAVHRSLDRMATVILIAACLVVLACGVSASPAGTHRDLSDQQLLNEVERRAVLFFWERSDPETGLTCDRAKNDGSDFPTVASIASTGYALAALPIGVEHGWISRTAAETRARRTLRFALYKLASNHGWLYHFVDRRSGARVWNCEVSSIDTTLLVAGALAAGAYFGGETQKLADILYQRMDWTWMRTHGGQFPHKLIPSMGWTPEHGFLKADWAGFSEAVLLYLIGLGSNKPLPPESWKAWKRSTFRYAGMEALGGGPIFLHQMPYGYFNVQNMRDNLGIDYWASSVQATRINRKYCMDLAGKRKTYGPDVWGLNACDGPDGYQAYGVPAPEDGTVSPTGALASIIFTPDLSISAARTMYRRFGQKIWGKYGFADAFNVDRNWYDRDVIGIDLGMALLAVENHRTGLIWRLMASLPSTHKALKAAGFHKVDK